MASAYHLRTRESTRALFTRLVDCILEKPSSQDSALAVKFCLERSRYHRFLDTNPKEVDRQIESLEEDLRINSQLRKAAKLRQAVAKLLNSFASSSDYCYQSEAGHAVLSLLYNLADDPANAPDVEETAGAQELVRFPWTSVDLFPDCSREQQQGLPLPEVLPYVGVRV
eukprot:jgi/Mesen1/8440/ME000475S07711